MRLILAELGYIGGDAGGMWISYRTGAEPYGFVFDVDDGYRVENATLATFLVEAGIAEAEVWRAVGQVVGP